MAWTLSSHTEKSDVTYEVDMADHKKRKRIFHINALKKWHSPVPAVLYTEECSENVEPLTWNDSDYTVTAGSLTPDQLQYLNNLKKFSDAVSNVPGQTTLIEHSIKTEDNKLICLPAYRLPQAMQTTLREEFKQMLDQGIVRLSTSEWAAYKATIFNNYEVRGRLFWRLEKYVTVQLLSLTERSLEAIELR